MAVSLLEARRRILLNTPHIESASGSVATFNTDLSANLKECKIHFLPVQEGSGDPSPDNVRPITGWDGMTITRCGKNLFGGDALVNAFTSKGVNPDTVNKTLTYTGSQANSVGRLFENFDEGQYTIVVRYASNASNKNANMKLYYTDGASMIISDNSPNCVEISSDGCRKFLTPLNKMCSHLDAELVSGTATLFYEDFGVFKGDVLLSDFAQYTALKIPISFGRTIYGGYVDLIKGEVVEEYRLLDLGTLKWAYGGGDGTIWFIPSTITPTLKPAPSNNTIMVCYCEKYRTMAYGRFSHNNANNYAIGIDNIGKPRIRDDDYDNSTITEFNTSLSGVMIAAELAEPVRYQLAPVQIKTLKGINNIWSDANGDVEVKFWKH